MNLSMFRVAVSSSVLALVLVGCSSAKLKSPVVQSAARTAFESELAQLADASKKQPDLCAEYKKGLDAIPTVHTKDPQTGEKVSRLTRQSDLPKLIQFLEHYPFPSTEFLRASQMIVSDLPAGELWAIEPMNSIGYCSEMAWFNGVQIAVNSLGTPSQRKVKLVRSLEARLRRTILERAIAMTSSPSTMVRQLFALGGVRVAMEGDVLPVDEETRAELALLIERTKTAREQAKAATERYSAIYDNAKLKNASEKQTQELLQTIRASLRDEMKASEVLRLELAEFLENISPL